MYLDESNLSQSADAERMAQFIDACQAAVDAWDDMLSMDRQSILAQQRGQYSRASTAAREAGRARSDARIAMHTADGLL